MPANGKFSLSAGEAYNSDHSSKDYGSVPGSPNYRPGLFTDNKV
jgi:hypothetical protein